jgi:hypothetical protein
MVPKIFSATEPDHRLPSEVGVELLDELILVRQRHTFFNLRRLIPAGGEVQRCRCADC